MLLMDDGFICKLSSLAPLLHLNERESASGGVGGRDGRLGGSRRGQKAAG